MKIKICGLTRVEEAEYLNRNRVDLAGMVVFYPKSKRNVTLEQAGKIMRALRPEIKKVAVTVSPGKEEIKRIEAAGFDYIQIHGALNRELLTQITIPALKGFNITDMDRYEEYHRCPQVEGYVFDALEPGSGKTFDWKLVDTVPGDEKLLLLAGGLTADNVGKAIACLHPDGVDVSSGVEYEDGRPGKDGERIDRFVKAVRAAVAG